MTKKIKDSYEARGGEDSKSNRTPRPMYNMRTNVKDSHKARVKGSRCHLL